QRTLCLLNSVIDLPNQPYRCFKSPALFWRLPLIGKIPSFLKKPAK
ncbi:MAG: hypothetical protein ACI8VR_003059, partial [Candidatus Azotimanducaceae bacterium]